MGSSFYLFGLITLAFGGFLYTGGDQSFVGLVLMLVGFCVGAVGLLHDGISDSRSRAVQDQSGE